MPSALHAEGRTVLLITHDPDVAARADRITGVLSGYLPARKAARVEPVVAPAYE